MCLQCLVSLSNRLWQRQRPCLHAAFRQVVIWDPMAAALAQGRLAADLLLWRTRAWTLLHHGVDLSPQSVKTASKSGERALQGAKNLTQDVVRTPNSAKNASQSVKRTPQSAWTAPRGVGITLRCSTGLQKSHRVPWVCRRHAVTRARKPSCPPVPSSSSNS